MKAAGSFWAGQDWPFCKLHGFQEIGHIAAQYVQGPDPFLILKDFFRRRAMDLVPIAARDNGHFLDGKVLVHLVKGRRGPRPAGTDDGCGRFEVKCFVAVSPCLRIKSPVEKRLHIPRKSRIVDGRPKKKAVCL